MRYSRLAIVLLLAACKRQVSEAPAYAPAPGVSVNAAALNTSEKLVYQIHHR
jgi:hypothetical protein